MARRSWGPGKFTTRDFCKAVVARLASDGVRSIPLENPRLQKAFSEILDGLKDEYRDAVSKGERRAVEIMRIIDQISADSNTGAYDALWATFRKLQPGLIRIGNPEYVSLDLSLDPVSATERLKQIQPEWQSIVENSANKIRQAL